MIHSMVHSLKRLVPAVAAVILAVSAVVLPATSFSQVEGYPEREIRMIVPMPPGGPTDALARQIAQYLGEGLGRPVIVDNKPGAGGTLAGALAAQAPADGYTFLFGNSAVLTAGPALYPKLKYDPLKSFTSISTISTGYMVLVVRKDVPARNLTELVALAKAEPNSLNYGSAGNGSPLHIGGELFKAITGAQIVHIPYKGSGPALFGLLSGQVQVFIDLPPTLLPHIQSGELRPLAVAGPTRLPAIPDVPTAAESGVQGFEMNLFTSLVAPAGIPQPIAERVNAEMQKILVRADLREQLARQSFILAERNTLQQADAFLHEQVKQWAHFVDISKARID